MCYTCFMKQSLFALLILLGTGSAYAQDDVVPVAVPPVPAHPQAEVQKPGTEARAKANVEWMYNHIQGLESERIQCLLELNRQFLDSFSLAADADSSKRFQDQKRYVLRREAALKECLGERAFQVLQELREKNHFQPGHVSGNAPVLQSAASPQTSAKTKKTGKAASKGQASNVAATPKSWSDALEGEQQP